MHRGEPSPVSCIELALAAPPGAGWMGWGVHGRGPTAGQGQFAIGAYDLLFHLWSQAVSVETAV